MENAIEAKALVVDRGNHTVLKGPTCSVPRASVTELLGPSRRGKTTLLRCIVGVQRMRAGPHRRLAGLKLRWGQNGQVQFWISGKSSPISLVYIRALSRQSSISCRTWAARGPSPGTRSMTSITRW